MESVSDIRLDLLELFGRGYVIEHCISFFKKKQEERAFRIYVTDALQILTENTKNYLASSGFVEYGTSLSSRWVDVIGGNDGKKEREEDERPCKEVAADIFKRAGISGKG